jgi:RimJ/RimL family protein N-acetyltransferase
LTATKFVRLIAIYDRTADVLSRNPEAFERDHAVRIGAQRELMADVAGQTLAMVRRVHAVAPWFGYFAADAASREVVGCCGFKGGPDSDGAVEIAYGTFPPFERQGYATAMAKALLEIARGSREVRGVIAHTLPEKNASASVLRKIGLAFTGEVNHPEDGRVWRWFLSLGNETVQKERAKGTAG